MRSQMSHNRRSAMWRWMTQPWRSVGLAIALIASFAVPSLMAATGDLLRESAAETITQQLVAESVDELGMTVIASGTPTEQKLNGIDAALGGRIDDVPLLGQPIRTVFVRQVGLKGHAANDGTAALVGSNGMLFQRAGAIDSLQVIAGDTDTEGLWISERVAEQFGLRVGDDVTVVASGRVPIAGIYPNLWEGERDLYWDTVPPTLVPRYVNAFAGPSLELHVVSKSVMHKFGLPGEVRLDAPLDLNPDSYKSLVGLAYLYRDIERSYTQSPELSQAIEAFSGAGATAPTLQTGLFDLERQADQIVAELEQPVQTTSVAGIVIGLPTAAAQKWRAESFLEAAASKTAMLSCRLNRCIDPTDTTVVPDLLLLGLQAGEAVCQIEVEIEIRLD